MNWARSRPELSAKPVGLDLWYVAAKRLHPRPVGGRAACLPAAADKHLRAARLGAGCHLVGEPTLPDSGLAAQQDEPAVAGERVGESTIELLQLCLTADEDTPRRRFFLGARSGHVERAVMLQDRLL